MAITEASRFTGCVAMGHPTLPPLPRDEEPPDGPLTLEPDRRAATPPSAAQPGLTSRAEHHRPYLRAGAPPRSSRAHLPTSISEGRPPTVRSALHPLGTRPRRSET